MKNHSDDQRRLTEFPNCLSSVVLSNDFHNIIQKVLKFLGHYSKKHIPRVQGWANLVSNLAFSKRKAMVFSKN
jgi:hypothetical protein